MVINFFKCNYLREAISLIVLFMLGTFCYAQEVSLITEISSDTILQGNRIEVRFTAENIQANFEAPDFGELRVVSGPNMATSMQIINGKYTSSQRYSYQLLGNEIGEFFISPSYFATADTTYETPPFSIIILPNPNEEVQRIKKFKVIGEINDTLLSENKDQPSRKRRRKKIKL